MLVRSAAESVYSGGGKERCCKKAGHKWQAGILVRSHIELGASR